MNSKIAKWILLISQINLLLKEKWAIIKYKRNYQRICGIKNHYSGHLTERNIADESLDAIYFNHKNEMSTISQQKRLLVGMDNFLFSEWWGCFLTSILTNDRDNRWETEYGNDRTGGLSHRGRKDVLESWLARGQPGSRPVASLSVRPGGWTALTPCDNLLMGHSVTGENWPLNDLGLS